MTTVLWLTTCATAGSDAPRPCPPVMVDSAADQARAAAEVEALPEGAVVCRCSVTMPSCAIGRGRAG